MEIDRACDEKGAPVMFRFLALALAAILAVTPAAARDIDYLNDPAQFATAWIWSGLASGIPATAR